MSRATVKRSGGEHPAKKKRGFLRRLLRWGAFFALALLAMIAAGEFYVSAQCRGRMFNHLEDVPPQSAGLVLGCSPKRVDGSPNPFFQARMEAAAELVKSGKVGFLILSGDNGERYYNEPLAMFEALKKRGVASNQLVLDYAGFRTLDSVVRADKVFGQNSFVIVSQPFHNERALAIARHFGMDAVGYNADAITGSAGIRTILRERPARVKLLLDLFVLGTEPRFLGEPVTPPEFPAKEID